jgi:hypothetical protein
MQTITGAAIQAAFLCLRTMPILIATLVVVDVLTVLGVLKRLSFIVAPIARVARLSEASTLALVTAVGSTLSADSMTARFFQEGRIRGREALLSAQANTIPAYLRECFTYFIPVVVPLLGVWPGVLYVSAFLLNAFLKVGFVLLTGRWIAGNCDDRGASGYAKDDSAKLEWDNRMAAIGRLLKKSTIMIIRVSLLLFVSTFVIILLDKLGYLDSVSVVVKPLMSFLSIPDHLFMPICGYIASPTAGAAALGTFYKAGEISMYCTAVGALIGGALSLTIATLRYTIPRNIAMFGPRVGSANAALGFSFALASRITLVVVIVLLFRR